MLIGCGVTDSLRSAVDAESLVVGALVEERLILSHKAGCCGWARGSVHTRGRVDHGVPRITRGYRHDIRCRAVANAGTAASRRIESNIDVFVKVGVRSKDGVEQLPVVDNCLHGAEDGVFGRR